MSVTVEFSLDTEDFLFGSVLATEREMDIVLDAIVPTGTDVLPYFWATGEDFDAFEHDVLAAAHVDVITQLDLVDDTALYRVEWSNQQDSLIDLLAESDAVVLEGRSSGASWHFSVRFPTNETVSAFYDACREHDLRLHVETVHSTAEASRAGREFGLSEPQREALVHAVVGGYFQVPRGTDLSKVAADLGISQQAASKNVRRGADRVLRTALAEYVAEHE
jgi:hypothetical protein